MYSIVSKMVELEFDSLDAAHAYIRDKELQNNTKFVLKKTRGTLTTGIRNLLLCF